MWLLIHGGAAATAKHAWAAPPGTDERIIFVDAPLRLVRGCQLLDIAEKSIVCATRSGERHLVAVSPALVVSRGRDTTGLSGLRLGDTLDIKLGIDGRNRDIALFIWANLVKVEGVVAGGFIRPYQRWIRLETLDEDGAPGAPTFVMIDQRTDFLAGSKRGDIRDGRPAIVIGERIGEGRVVASRIILQKD